MKGTDLTDAQIQSARQFLVDRRSGDNKGVMPADEENIVQSFGNLARVVAWYGALRYEAGRNGTGGTLENPGPIEEKVTI